MKRYKTEELSVQKVGQKCYDLELLFCDFPERIGYELKQQLKIRQLRKNISTTAYIKRLKKIKNFDIIMINKK